MTDSYFKRIYGITIDEYLHEHMLTLNDLIRHIEKDLDLLKRNYMKYIYKDGKIENIEYSKDYSEVYQTTLEIKARIKEKEKLLEEILPYTYQCKYLPI